MKDTHRTIWGTITALALVIVLAVSGCDNAAGGGGDPTLTAEQQANLDDFGDAAIAGTFDVTDAESWAAAISAINAGGNGTAEARKNYVINAAGSIGTRTNNSTGSTFEPSHITVSLRGSGELRLSGNGVVLLAKQNQTLILRGPDIRGSGEDGVTPPFGSGGAVYIRGGSVILREGTVYNNYGPGVEIRNGGAFTMTGGTVRNNRGAASDGGTAFYGGVKISGGRFAMSGGNINDNTGRGVFVSGAAGSFSMSGGTIERNDGGVEVAGDINAGFQMSGGTIAGNTAAKGGGVLVGGAADGTRFRKYGGTIAGNTAANGAGNGHAAFIAQGGSAKYRDADAGPSVMLDAGYFPTESRWLYNLNDPQAGDTTANWLP